MVLLNGAVINDKTVLLLNIAVGCRNNVLGFGCSNSSYSVLIFCLFCTQLTDYQPRNVPHILHIRITENVYVLYLLLSCLHSTYTETNSWKIMIELMPLNELNIALFKFHIINFFGCECEC